jgi:hypothetical protein
VYVDSDAKIFLILYPTQKTPQPVLSCAIKENEYVILEELNAIIMTLRAFTDQQDVFHFLEWF